MQAVLKKIKFCLVLFCIGSMATLIGVPIISQEKIEQIIQAKNRDVAAEVEQASDEQR
ncbi:MULTISPECIES: hypothetical protein [Cyanophyceae]|uniref:hypothetical protein n=1 Tax=Cyanophyceae TaxID=3028117 RepID=UPI001686C02A|nr:MULTISPECIES: hypothetical protein [Cyanophyceae]MBD1914383.1 hypothetical protein [Phormidium sp. FACHB-77]